MVIHYEAALYQVYAPLPYLYLYVPLYYTRGIYAPFFFLDEAALIERGSVGDHLVGQEDVLVMDENVAHEVHDVRMMLDGVAMGRRAQQRRTEADRQVVRIHHVLVRELRHAAANTNRHCVKLYPSTNSYHYTAR